MWRIVVGVGRATCNAKMDSGRVCGCIRAASAAASLSQSRCPMTEAELAAVIVTVGLGTVLSNLILFGLMVKLYTEFAKQRMQEVRKP